LSKLQPGKDPETGKVLSPTEIGENLIMMMSAGSDTTGATASAVLFNVATNPRVQNKLLEEIDAIQAQHPDETLDSDLLEKHTYLEVGGFRPHIEKLPPILSG
jgi:cytochrome P450